MKLNLGACDRAFEGFLSVDQCEPADIVADLRKPWPWPDSSVEHVLALDVFEHLPDRVFTMNELHRVLKPGGIANIEVPNAAKGAGQHQDPTHVSTWCMNSFQYYEHEAYARKRFAPRYGITARFRVISITERPYQDAYEEVWKILATLEAVK